MWKLWDDVEVVATKNGGVPIDGGGGSGAPLPGPVTRSRPLARPASGLRLRRIPFAASQAAQVPAAAGRGGNNVMGLGTQGGSRFAPLPWAIIMPPLRGFGLGRTPVG